MIVATATQDRVIEAPVGIQHPFTSRALRWIAVACLGTFTLACSGRLGAVTGHGEQETGVTAPSSVGNTGTSGSPAISAEENASAATTPSTLSHPEPSSPSTNTDAGAAPSAGPAGAMQSDAGDTIPGACASAPPGHVGLQRLSLPQLENTLRDLLGFDVAAPPLYPRDDRTGGYITVPDAQLVSEALIEQHLNWSMSLAQEAVASGAPRVIVCDINSAGCADEIVENFLRRAFRRPPRDEELEHFQALYAAALDSTHDPLQTTLAAILNAPQFLFRERDVQAPTRATPLSNHDLATRLSYFVWNSMPDDELMAAADAGTLTDPRAREAQVERLLASPRSIELARTMADQWLDLSRLWDHALSEEAFPEYDSAMKESMYQESVRLLAHVLQTARPISELVTAAHSFVDARLAQLYGLPGSFGDEFVLTDTAPLGARPGLLGHAGILALTSSGEKTSIIRRGKWVTSALLCLGVPPPPATLDTSLNVELPENATPREIVAAHRANAACVACHQQIDPPGVVLESFDPLGRIRTHYPPPIDRDVDTGTQLVDGTTVANVVEFSLQLAESPQFSRCVTDRIFPLAVGRLLGANEDALLEQLGAMAPPRELTLVQVVSHLVQSSAFGCDSGEPMP